MLSRGSGSARASVFFFFNDTESTEIYTLSLHDALPISWRRNQEFVARITERSQDVGIRFARARRKKNILSRNVLSAIGVVAGDGSARGFQTLRRAREIGRAHV